MSKLIHQIFLEPGMLTSNFTPQILQHTQTWVEDDGEEEDI